jgi:hypothetical protein
MSTKRKVSTPLVANPRGARDSRERETTTYLSLEIRRDEGFCILLTKAR